ncbi:MAG TPA: MFS transporter [Flexivirga sp.]|uniref:MFS transporter n=1 Tax=Flexivirga sp. TaxID=1962927 RepID=UPI002CE66738|nr:MFS transporter [Flexivirga sp.]HWC24154.1 MFS transporter [Flexivirga sp.]
MTELSACTAGLETPEVQRLQRRTLRTLAVAQVVGAIGVGVVPSVGVLLAEQMTASEVWAGLARTGSTVGAAAVGIPLANMAIRYGRRWALGCGWIVAAVGSALLVLAAQLQNLPALVLGLLVAGAGSGTQLQARFAAADLAAPAHKARALSLVVSVGAIGAVLGPNLGAPGAAFARRVHLAELGGAFVFAVVALLIAGIVTIVRLRPDPLLTALEIAEDAAGQGGVGETVARNNSRRGHASWGAVMELCSTNRSAALALTAIVTAQVLMVTVMTMAPVHMAAEGGSLTVVGVSISLHVLAMYGPASISGMISDRFGVRVGMCLGVALFAGSFLAAILGVDSMTFVTISLILLGLGWSVMSVGGAASLSRVVADDQRTQIQGFADMASNMTAAGGAFLGGPIMAVVGYNGLAMIAAVALGPICLLLFARDQGGTPVRTTTG